MGPSNEKHFCGCDHLNKLPFASHITFLYHCIKSDNTNTKMYMTQLCTYNIIFDMVRIFVIGLSTLTELTDNENILNRLF